MPVSSQLSLKGWAAVSHHTYLGTLREVDGPGEPPGPPLTNRIPMFIFLSRLGDLPANGEVPTVYLDIDLVLGKPRKLERGRHEILFCVLV